MKSDRRTLTVAAVFVCFLLLSGPFRGFFLFGARLFASHLTLKGQYVTSPTSPTATFNLGAWLLTPPPQQSGPTRDERLGLVLVQMEQDWNKAEAEGRNACAPLETFCQTNPDDLGAKSHLVRLVLNMQSLEKVKDKVRLRALAERLVGVAAAGAKMEPNNWYWRERQFHLLYLIGDTKGATEVWIAKPFPTTFDDHVFDEITCKEALYRGQFMDLPKSAFYPIWGGVMFPHLSTGSQLKELIKSSSESIQLRVGEMELGRAMLKSCPTTIAAMVGIRHIRLGLWGSDPKIATANAWQDFFDAEKQKEVEEPYRLATSKEARDYCLRVAKSDVVPRFLQPDQNLAGIFVGQFGPFLIYAGISCILIGIGYLLLNRTKLKALGAEHLVWPVLLAVVTNSDIPFFDHMVFLTIAIGLFFLIKFKLKKLTFENLGWPSLLVVLSFVGSSWKDWGYFANASLANVYFFFLLVPLAASGIVIAARKEKGKRIVPALTLVAALLFGLAYRGWEATSTIFVLLFLMQQGSPQLKPWPIAITLLLAGYHFAINQGLHTGDNEVPLGFFSVLVVLFLMSKREVEPDQPRLSLVTVGLGAAMLGTILIAQYDNGYKTAMESDLKQIDEVRAKFANL